MGSSFVFRGTQIIDCTDGIVIDNCQRVTIRNSSYDDGHLPFVQTTLLSKSGSSATFKQVAGYHDPSATARTWDTAQRIEDYNPATGLWTKSIIECNGQANGAGSGGLPPNTYRNRAITPVSSEKFTVNLSEPNDAPQLTTMTVGKTIPDPVTGLQRQRASGDWNA